MKYFVMFLDHSGPVGVGAIWADGARWVRFYGDSSKDYPRPIFYGSAKEAISHARSVLGWLKRNDGANKTGFHRKFSYKVLSLYLATEVRP